MDISIFDLFSVGIGPSSSHTVGPMTAAHRFATGLSEDVIASASQVQIELFGSLALTGIGHGTDKAVLLGLEAEHPTTIDPDHFLKRFLTIANSGKLNLAGRQETPFELIWHRDQTLPRHTNGMCFSVLHQTQVLAQTIFYSVGGGFIVTETEFDNEPDQVKAAPYPFNMAAELLTHCRDNQFTIDTLMMTNEQTWRTEEDIRHGLLERAKIMDQCIERGLNTTGFLPGGLSVERRAPQLYQQLLSGESQIPQNKDMMSWLNAYAMAVNEENAAGGRIVTAPTNGAAGIIPAVLRYYREFCDGNDDGVITFLLTAGAIAILYKKRASISGAEVGCQGEVGVACSMAAGALAAVLGGTLDQIENAAEIGMEHNLGLTCDPVHGLVQIPCIERNAMGAVKAVNAAGIALMETGANKITLDQVIDTMKRTGDDMNTIYKETSLGGLAVNVPEC